MITALNIKKKFGGQQVLSNVTFNIAEGEIFGLLGPSGAGKTTIINILTNQLKEDSGTKEVKALSHEIGIMLDIGGLYNHLTCIENLNLYSTIYGLPKGKPMEVLETVGLAEAAKKACGKTITRNDTAFSFGTSHFIRTEATVFGRTN